MHVQIEKGNKIFDLIANDENSYILIISENNRSISFELSKEEIDQIVEFLK